MKIICPQPTLNKALITVQKAITTRTTIPILKGILIQTIDDQHIQLTATDSEISIETICECVVEEEGSVVLSSKLFTDMIRKLPDDEVTITSQDEIVHIQCRSYQSDIASFPAEEFPMIPEVGDLHEIHFPCDIFRNMIRMTAFAASTDESRGILTGILIELNEEQLSMVALDGFRMSIVREDVSSDQELNIVISARILSEVNKILSEEEEESFDLILDEKKAKFQIGATTVTSRLLEGKFLDYEGITPKEMNSKVVADRNEMMEVIDRASLIKGKNNLIKMMLQGNTMTITSRDEEGTIQEEFDIYLEGDSLEIGFNAKYVMDVLKVLEEDRIYMEFGSSISPLVVKPEEGENYQFLVLPVRLNS